MALLSAVSRLILPLLLLAEAAAVAAQAPPLAIPALIGPKPTIAVGTIEATGGYGDTNWDVGNGLRSMLTKVLGESGRFVIVERANLDQVLNERQLQATRLAGGDSGGVRMIAAQYLVVGSVAEFGSPKSGGGISIGGGLFGGLGALALSRKTGKVKIDLRVVDARSAQVVTTFTVEKSASRTGVGFSGDYSGISFGSEAFVKTPLGEASRKALEDAAARIAYALSSGPWEGKVVAMAAGTVFVNAGSEAGLQVGDRLRIERLVAKLTDPDTGQVLSEKRYSLGEVTVGAIEPKLAEGQFVPATAGVLPERGDAVIFVAR